MLNTLDAWLIVLLVGAYAISQEVRVRKARRRVRDDIERHFRAMVIIRERLDKLESSNDGVNVL